MFDDEIVDKLNEIANDLLEQAGVLQERAEDTAENAERVQKALKAICSSLKKLLDLLEGPNSPLAELDRLIKGPLYALRRADLAAFLRRHRDAVERVTKHAGAAGRTIKRMVTFLEEETAPGAQHSLETPEEWDFAPALAAVRDFQQLICEIADSPALKALLAAPGALSAIADGVIGTATIIIDATAVAHDPTGLSFAHAVKSVWSGTSRVRKSVGKLRDLWASVQSSEAAKKGLENLKKQPPGRPLGPSKP